ncbi:MAG: carbon monoxide dehydrogenase, partial [Anaerolineae bacterium]
MAKKRQITPEKASRDPAAVELLQLACEIEAETAFARAEASRACNIGGAGLCCKNCSMGPCRLIGNTTRGVCGATLDTIVARNFARAVAAGASAHSDHGRDLAYTLLEAARGHAPDYGVKDPDKLMEVARHLGVQTTDEDGDRRPISDIAADVAHAALREFGKAEGELLYLKRAPKERQEIWKETGIAPRAVDREVVELLHRTHVGNDQEAEHILDHTMRCALGDGWGGSMLATDLTDILFGTPAPVRAESNLGVLRDDMVNIIIHGHEPTLSEMIVAASLDPKLTE